MYVNLNTQQVSETLPKWIQETQTSNPTLQMCAPYGWRFAGVVPAVAADYERLTPPTWAQDPADATCAIPVLHDTLIADRLAAEAAAAVAAAVAAAEAAEMARLPVPFPTGIESPKMVLIDVASGAAWAYVCDKGDLVGGVEQHASPTPDDATLEARRAAAVLAHRDRKARMAAIWVSMTDPIVHVGEQPARSCRNCRSTDMP
jgi:hypothetical protein